MERPSGPAEAVAATAGGPADLDLVDRIREGDQGALDLLYRRYSAPVYSLVWKVLQNSEEAEDVARQLLAAFEHPLEAGDLHDVVISPSRQSLTVNPNSPNIAASMAMGFRTSHA